EQEIILKNLETPAEDDITEDIDWLCRSFGFLTTRDKDETAAKVLQVIIDAMAKRQQVSSEQLARHCQISRAAVLYHVKNYMNTGIIVAERRAYVLRTKSMERTVEEIELDAMRIFTKLKKVAREIDAGLGLE
ncbi:hypothetical protein HY639_02340, partial [Candidatus Woesearchaeota archaeon]|nr:hypothetical protein [Candidatus Woesearchaeota archaeon]